MMILSSAVGKWILNIVLFILGLMIVVTIHELGHFSMAKLFNVYCKEFSIGFGPKIISKKRKDGETYFSWRAIPLGGFVSMYGENEEEEELDPTIVVPKERTLSGVAKWKRAIIMVAGVVCNFILALLLFVVNRTCFKQVYATSQIVVEEGSNAETSGLLTYDNVKEVSIAGVINGETREIYTFETNFDYYELWNNMVYASPETASDSLNYTFTVLRDTANTPNDLTDDKQIIVNISTTAYEQEDGTFAWNLIGISSYTYKAHMGFGNGIKQAFKDFGYGFTMIAKALGELFIGKGYENLGGPISLFKASSQVLENGFGNYLYLWGLISVNLGLFNLIPFPGLDGWHFVVIIVEAIFHKEIPNKVKNIISFIGMIMLFILMGVVLIKDIINFTSVVGMII